METLAVIAIVVGFVVLAGSSIFGQMLMWDKHYKKSQAKPLYVIKSETEEEQAALELYKP